MQHLGTSAGIKSSWLHVRATLYCECFFYSTVRTFVTKQNSIYTYFGLLIFLKEITWAFVYLADIVFKEILAVLLYLAIAQCHIVDHYKNKCLSLTRIWKIIYSLIIWKLRKSLEIFLDAPCLAYIRLSIQIRNSLYNQFIKLGIWPRI